MMVYAGPERVGTEGTSYPSLAPEGPESDIPELPLPVAVEWLSIQHILTHTKCSPLWRTHISGLKSRTKIVKTFFWRAHLVPPDTIPVRGTGYK